MSKRTPLAVLTILSLLALLLLAGGCRKKPPVVEPPQPAAPAPAPAAPAPPPVEVTDDFKTPPVEKQPVVEPSIDELNRSGVLKTVYFDFDRSDLDDGDRRILQGNADWMRANAQYGVVIEGHCDERGTIEYNLALGERRARSVRDYLTSLGISAGRMRIVSYGEERPADPGHSEAAWSKNRRAAFLIESRN